MRFYGGTGDGAGAQQARVVRRAQFIRLEVNQMNYSDVAEMGKDARERLFPVGIMLGFPFDPNRADDMPGEWERVSTIWRRVK